MPRKRKVMISDDAAEFIAERINQITGPTATPVNVITIMRVLDEYNARGKT
jgi:hypothetical protein